MDVLVTRSVGAPRAWRLVPMMFIVALVALYVAALLSQRSQLAHGRPDYHLTRSPQRRAEGLGASAPLLDRGTSRYGCDAASDGLPRGDVARHIHVRHAVGCPVHAVRATTRSPREASGDHHQAVEDLLGRHRPRP